MAASWNARQPGTETEDRQQAAGEEVGSPGGITDTGADRQVRIGHANHGDQEDGGGRHTKHGDDDPEDDGSQDGDGTIRGLCLDLVDHVDDAIGLPRCPVRLGLLLGRHGRRAYRLPARAILVRPPSSRRSRRSGAR